MTCFRNLRHSCTARSYTTSQLFINGEFVNSKSTEYFDVLNPADTTQIVTRTPLATPSELTAATTAAQNAFDNVWRDMPITGRQNVMFNLQALIKRDMDEIAAIIVAENIEIGGYDLIVLDRAGLGYDEELIETNNEVGGSACFASKWVDVLSPLIQSKVHGFHEHHHSRSTSCSNCVPGRYSGSTASSCSNCNPGKYSGSAASTCSYCNPGKYSGSQATSCSTCDPGMCMCLRLLPVAVLPWTTTKREVVHVAKRKRAAKHHR